MTAKKLNHVLGDALTSFNIDSMIIQLGIDSIFHIAT